ncbi:MAG: VCBS repeat-containing protein [Tunicatimonas sp.]
MRLYLFILFWLFSSGLVPSALFAQLTPPHFTIQTIDTISIGYGLAVGDVDGDQQPDILLADQQQFVWYRNGDWQRFVMVDQLTERDNVCLAAHDTDGDGRVEVAVGAQWNPGETSDPATSGSVHYLERPTDPTKLWTPHSLPHDPTVHRMAWLPTEDGPPHLLVLPLHGRGNTDGQGKGARVMAYRVPDNPARPWDTTTVNQQMHLTHNLEVIDENTVLVAGKEGVMRHRYQNSAWMTDSLPSLASPAGEVRQGHFDSKRPFIATVEPMHGQQLVVYKGDDYAERLVLSDNLQQGHALACADLMGLGYDQIVVGWREPNREGKVGIKLYVPVDTQGDGWMHHYIDEDGMACEDLKVADLDGDGDLDIVASGRGTQNLRVYWNQLND